MALRGHVASGILVSIGSGNGLSPVKHQAITWSHADPLLTTSLGTNFSEIWVKYKDFFFQNHAFEIVACKMSTIWFRFQSTKWFHTFRIISNHTVISCSSYNTDI